MWNFLTSQIMIGVYIGVLIGWVVFERPQWVKDRLAWLKAKVFG